MSALTIQRPAAQLERSLAVGLAITLILLLDGLWTGITRSVTAYEDNVGADLYVAQRGTRNFIGAVSQIPVGTTRFVFGIPAERAVTPTTSCRRRPMGRRG